MFYIKKTISLSLLLLSTTLINAQEYHADKNGNVNINIIDKKIMVNDKVVGRVKPNEPTVVNVDDVGVNLDREHIGVGVGDDVGVNLDRGQIGVGVGDDVGVNLDRGHVGVGVGDDVGVNLDRGHIGVQTGDDVSVKVDKDVKVKVGNDVSVNVGGLGRLIGSMMGDD